MRIHDGHIHVDTDAAERTAKAAAEGGAESWSVLSLGQYHDDPAQNLAMLLCKAYAPKQCFAFCSLDHPKKGEPAADYLAQLKMWLAAGFDGLKIIETKPNCAKETGVRMDDEAFEPMFAYCEEHQIPILWHNGDPADFWDEALNTPELAEKGWAYGDKSFLPLKELYAIVERVLDRHPKLNVTFAHFYFVSDDPAHAARMFEKYPNVRFDLTPGTEMYEGFTLRRNFFRPFFVENSHRILYGTDTDVTAGGTPDYTHCIYEGVQRFLTTGESFEFFGLNIHGYALPRPVLENIFRNTFVSFAGETPKPICREAVPEALRYVLSLPAMQNAEKRAQAEALCSKICSR